MKKRTRYSITSVMISLTLVAPTLTGMAPSSSVQAEERIEEDSFRGDHERRNTNFQTGRGIFFRKG